MKKIIMVSLAILTITATFPFYAHAGTPVAEYLGKYAPKFDSIMKSKYHPDFEREFFVTAGDTVGMNAFQDSLDAWKRYPSVKDFLELYGTRIENMVWEFSPGLLHEKLYWITDAVRSSHFPGRRDYEQEMHLQGVLYATTLEYVSDWRTNFRDHLGKHRKHNWNAWKKINKELPCYHRKYALVADEINHAELKCLIDLSVELSPEQYRKIAAGLDQLTLPVPETW